MAVRTGPENRHPETVTAGTQHADVADWRVRHLFIAAALAAAAGCGSEPEPRVLSVTVSAADPLDPTDVTLFLHLAERVPGEATGALAGALPVAPSWSPTDTRTVADLASREARELGANLQGPTAAEALSRCLLVKRAGWSPERWASLGASLGVARVALGLSDTAFLNRLRRRAELDVAELAADGRVFARLNSTEQATVLRRAAAVARLALLDAVLSVPAENLRLVADREDELRAVLPDAFGASALHALLPEADRRGVPFVLADPAADDGRLRFDGTDLFAAR